MSKTNESPVSNLSIKDNSIGGISFPSGSTLEVKFVDGKKEGEGIVYSPLYLMLAILQYHQDLLYGLCQFLNEKGQKNCECVYENGIRNGWIREYKDDKIIYTGICQNGEKVSELRNYNGKSGFFEEIQNNKRMSIRKFNSDFLGGICYCYENDKVKQVYKFQCGEKNKVMYEFDNSKMIEYDTNKIIVYVGEYEGNIENGYRRKNNIKALYDNNKRIIYKGDYDENTYQRKGKGKRYEYKDGLLKRVFVSENGGDVYKWIEIEGNMMTEYNENGLKVYIGGFNNDGYGVILRNGEGSLLEKEKIVYTGDWKKGKREGNGCYYQNGKLVYDGEWKDEKPNGQGKLYDKDRNVVWEGDWKNGYGDMGNGVWLYYEDGKKCGLYENGNRKY